MQGRSDGEQNTLTVSQASARLAMSAHTLRYYERAGLMRPVQRARNGHRRYTSEDLKRLLLLHTLRQTGMPIRFVRQFARGASEPAATRTLRLDLLRVHRAKLSATIDQLNAALGLVDEKLRQLGKR